MQESIIDPIDPNSVRRRGCPLLHLCFFCMDALCCLLFSELQLDFSVMWKKAFLSVGILRLGEPMVGSPMLATYKDSLLFPFLESR